MEGGKNHHGHQRQSEEAIRAATHVRGNQQGGQDVDMHQEPLYSYQEIHAAAVDRQIFAAAAPAAQDNSVVVGRAARGSAANNQQHAGPAGGADDPPSAPEPQERGASGEVITLHRQQPVGGGEAAATARLETRAGAQATTSRTVPGKEGIISAWQAMLADAAYSPVFPAGIEEVEHDNNSWYDTILHEAQAMEAMVDELGLNDKVPFQQQQLLTSKEEEPCYSPTRRSRDNPSDLDLDEAGPSMTTTQTQTRPTRVLPLADDEVPNFDCGLCTKTLPILDLFHGMQCEHRFCVKCMGTYIEARINAGEVPVLCPDPTCREAAADNALLHPELCKKSIDFAAFSSWGHRLTERAVPPNLRAYCPNSQCGVMLELEATTGGGKTPAEAFCPVCSHPMCATCGFGWSHDGSSQHDCDEGPNAELVKKLAEERRWKECPRCKMLVERIDGYDFMKCWCQFVFCYSCSLSRGKQTGMEQGAELCRCQILQHE